MVTVNLNGKMVPCIPVNGIMELGLELVYLDGATVMSIKANGRMEYNQAKEF